MKKRKIAYCCTFILAFFCCQVKSQQVANAGNTELGNKLIDAFYSFNKDTLALILSSAKTSQPDILYYQKWAECAHYKIVDRSHYFEKNDSTVVFPVTVKDDLMSALAIDFNVTDTFHITIKKGKIISVRNSSNDLDEYHTAKRWVNKNKPDLVKKACKGIWKGGPTPCDCVLGMIKGFAAYKKHLSHQ